MKVKLIPLLVALAVGAFAAAGCGGDDNSKSDTSASSAPPSKQSTDSSASTETDSSAGGGGNGSQLKISADPSGALKYDKTSLEAEAGKVTIQMDNPSSVPHAVSIEGNGVDEDGNTVTQGGKSMVTANLKAGTYTFYCPVDGHEQAGMKGTLTVK
jgi:plastocyanin